MSGLTVHRNLHWLPGSFSAEPDELQRSFPTSNIMWLWNHQEWPHKDISQLPQLSWVHATRFLCWNAPYQIPFHQRKAFLALDLPSDPRTWDFRTQILFVFMVKTEVKKALRSLAFSLSPSALPIPLQKGFGFLNLIPTCWDSVLVVFPGHLLLLPPH